MLTEHSLGWAARLLKLWSAFTLAVGGALCGPVFTVSDQCRLGKVRICLRGRAVQLESIVLEMQMNWKLYLKVQGISSKCQLASFWVLLLLLKRTSWKSSFLLFFYINKCLRNICVGSKGRTRKSRTEGADFDCSLFICCPVPGSGSLAAVSTWWTECLSAQSLCPEYCLSLWFVDVKVSYSVLPKEVALGPFYYH